MSVSGTATNTNYAGGLPVTGAALTIADDDTPSVTLTLSASSISENGGAATVTATQDRADDADTRITVSVTPTSPATANDYRLSANVTLTIPAGQLSSTGTVTITAVNNSAIEADKQLSITGTASNTNYARGLPVTDAILTITDDDTPSVTLTLSTSSIVENGGAATVTATQDKPDDADTRITVSVAPTSPATANDYRLSANTTLIIPAGQLSSTRIVTITAVDNDDVAADKRLTVRGTASNTNYAGGLEVTGAALTIANDDAPAVTPVAVGLPHRRKRRRVVHNRRADGCRPVRHHYHPVGIAQFGLHPVRQNPYHSRRAHRRRRTGDHHRHRRPGGRARYKA